MERSKLEDKIRHIARSLVGAQSANANAASPAARDSKDVDMMEMYALSALSMLPTPSLSFSSPSLPPSLPSQGAACLECCATGEGHTAATRAPSKLNDLSPFSFSPPSLSNSSWTCSY